MGQDELVLRVASDPGQTRTPESDRASETQKPRSHSRESSGASNLSVKFTVHSDGSSSPKASVHHSLPSFKPLNSCLRRRLNDENPSRRNVGSDGDKVMTGDPMYDSDHSCDSLSVEDRLSPTHSDNQHPSRPSRPRMFHRDPQNPNSDYGSFSNTPSDTFGATGGQQTSGHSGGEYQPQEEQHHRGHQRNDSEIQMISDASQTRPLLDNHDSSSDDDGNSNFGINRKKARNTRSGGTVQIEIPSMESTQTDDTEDSDDEDGIAAEPLKTLIAFLFLFFAWVATTTSLALTHERVPQIAPLPDIFLDNVQYQPWGLDASEILIMVSTWTAFLITLFHKHRFVVLRRVFFIVGLHYYYRAITMYITVLPKPNEEYLCAPKLNETTASEIARRVLKLLSGMGLSINGKHVYCGDYIYSGHTMTLIMGYFVIREYSPRSWFLLHWASFATTVAGVLLLLLARGHYSIDVLIAYWITSRVWWLYHTLVNNVNLKGEVDNPQNYMNRMWWWYIFRYFEKNVPVNLPRRFGWPLPKKLRRWKPSCFLFRRRSLRSSSTPSTAAVASTADVERNAS